MQKITSIEELRKSILLLEIKQANEAALLKEELKTTYESLKPVNLIKNALCEITSAPDFHGNILNASMSIAAGYLSKKIAIGSTHNPIKQLLGSILQMGVTKLVSKNTDGIRSGAGHLINNVLSKKETQTL